MKAVVLRKTNDLAVCEVPVPQLSPDQVLVRTTHCGICGSDIRYLRGDNPWAKQTLGEKHTNPPNIILGHEVTGVVEAVGSRCDVNLVGKRVAIVAFGTCGKCIYCRRGEEHLCAETQHLGHGAGWGESDYYYGGMAEYVPVNEKWLVLLPETISNEAGALLDPLGVAVHGVKTANVREDDVVLIVGGGAVGALAVSVARARGAKYVVLLDICDSVLPVAECMGADYAVNPMREDVADLIKDLSGGHGAEAIIDTVGAPLMTYLPLLARGGIYVTMTVTSDSQDFKTILLAGERTIKSSCNFQYSDYWEALSLLENSETDFCSIITHRFAVDDALEAFRVAEDKAETGAVKVIILF
jgi:threonine dehydrogenase-like Zn-dependent dehydrogenase